ncbi:MAG TPA: prolyl aminopeptidase [Thermoanaerobaculia bacterium]|nr:prolyl aminopeptidase [Thermoanaerobaculia bacterium]
MSRRRSFATTAILLSLLACGAASAQDELFPEIEPYDSGYLKVSDVHEIYYEQSGNPQGKPVFFLHGGPGGGTSPGQRRYYDPKKFRIVLHDQRGAGKSRPFADIRQNTTWDLVEDIERLRKHVGVDRMILLGGSWGSTLALAYAEKYPERVSGLILRGVYLGTKDEMERFYTHGVAEYFPEVSERLWSQVPEIPGKTPPQRILAMLNGPDEAARKRVAKAWAAYETKVAFLQRSDEEVEKGFTDGWDPLAFSRIENHYMANDCFLEEGQLLRDAGKLKDIPAVLVNGRYDVIAPPITAWKLHKALPKSQIWIVESAGHAGSEPGIAAALVRAVRTFE